MNDEGREPKPDSNNHTPILLLDVSTSGALLECENYIKPSAKATIQIPLGEDLLEVQGIVVHCAVHEIRHSKGDPDQTVYHVGIKFESLPPDFKATIQELIKQRLYHERREQPRLYVGRQSWLREDT